jgi:hypothetical protein
MPWQYFETNPLRSLVKNVGRIFKEEFVLPKSAAKVIPVKYLKMFSL